MRDSTKRIYFTLSFAFLAGGLLFISVLAPIIGTDTDLSVYNSGWNGASQLGRSIYETGTFEFSFALNPSGDGLQVTHLSFVTIPLVPAESSIFIVGPDRPFTPEELRYLRQFVQNGGNLLLADDYGTGNQVLEGINATTRIEPGVILDLAFEKQPHFAVALNLTPDPLTANVSGLVLNRAAPLAVQGNARVLATTSSESWIDGNDDLHLDADEQRGPFPVLASETLGRGTVLILSDPSLLSNGMRGVGHNEVFTRNVVQVMTTGRTKALLDESHHEYTTPVSVIGTRITAVPPAVRLTLLAASFLLFASLITNPWGHVKDWTRRLVDRLLPEEADAGEPTPEELLQRLKAKHPDWSENALTELLTEWKEKAA